MKYLIRVVTRTHQRYLRRVLRGYSPALSINNTHQPSLVSTTGGESMDQLRGLCDWLHTLKPITYALPLMTLMFLVISGQMTASPNNFP